MQTPLQTQTSRLTPLPPAGTTGCCGAFLRRAAPVEPLPRFTGPINAGGAGYDPGGVNSVMQLLRSTAGFVAALRDPLLVPNNANVVDAVRWAFGAMDANASVEICESMLRTRLGFGAPGEYHYAVEFCDRVVGAMPYAAFHAGMRMQTLMVLNASARPGVFALEELIRESEEVPQEDRRYAAFFVNRAMSQLVGNEIQASNVMVSVPREIVFGDARFVLCGVAGYQPGHYTQATSGDSKLRCVYH